MQNGWLSFDADNARAGFRLRKLEVYNWGTFHGRVHRIAPEGCTALLTGHNGSGKSTLVDALITLLVPNRHQQRSYNVAAGSGKRERTERSYVLGAYGSEQREDSNRARTTYLREPGDISVLLAHFHNEGYQQDVTLAQVLYLTGDGAPEHEFFVAPRELSIATDFSLEGTPEKLRHELQKRGVRWFAKFPAYSAHFRTLLHLDSEKALDLFNQTVSIKEVNDLSDFLRTHMLERSEVGDKIAELRQNYDDLSKIFERIQRERKMLETLEPITSRAEQYRTTAEALGRWRTVAEELDGYFAREHTRLLRAGIEKAEAEKQLAEQRKERLDGELKQAFSDKVDLEVARKRDETGQRVAQLETEIERTASERKQRETDAATFRQLLADVGVALPFETEKDFASVQQKITERHVQVKGERDPIFNGIASFTAQRQQREARHKEVEDELRSLAQRKDSIPEQNRRVRAALLEAIDATPAEIPFIGELVQVKKEAEVWEPAVEKLLRSFALGLLVPDADYGDAADAYFNATDINARAVCDRVGEPPPMSSTPRVSADSLLHKLEFHPEHPLAWWVERRIAEHFNYLCTDDLHRFARADLALTSSGYIKSGRTRRVKDDRHKLGDRSQYVLGWTNERKIEAFRAEYLRLSNELRSLKDTLKGMQEKLTAFDSQLTVFGALSGITRFAQIDALSLLRRVGELEQEKRELEGKSDALKTLNKKIATIEERITSLTEERDQAIIEIGKRENDIKTYNKRINTYAPINERWKDLDLAAVEAKVAERLTTPATLDDITDLRDSLRAETGKEVGQHSKTESDLREKIVQTMSLFRDHYSDEEDGRGTKVRDFGDDIRALDDYCGVADSIRRHGLPQHEREFQEMLKNNVVRDIALFRRELESQVSDIREHICELNRSLSQLDYSEDTYIELLPLDAGDARVQEFRGRLRACIEGAIGEGAEGNEARFIRIKELIDLFAQQPDWMRHVTDVRQWLDFAASENRRADGSRKNYFEGSGGRSGGQKAKLAFTILASAIAYQFGLRPGETRSRSFRFVAVDEMFSKSDDDNSRYALELFRQLDLQLLIICPFDAKALVVEPYTERYHFAANPTETASEVFNLTVRQWEEKRREMRETRRA